MKICVHDAIENKFWLDKFNQYRNFIVKKHRLPESNRIENYTEQRFKIDDLLGLYVMTEVGSDKIAGFTSVARIGSWPSDVARICNRTWIDPIYRAKGLSRSDVSGTNMRSGNKWGISYAYDQQIECCKKNNIQLAIITRENTPNFRAKNTMYSAYRGLKMVRKYWQFDPDNYYLTYQNKSSYRCWQKIVWTELTPNASVLLNKIPKISNQSFLDKFSEPSR